MKQRLILKNFLSPGDIVMLTAALRDLHRCYPGVFETDVRTPYPELWENNPYLTPLAETLPEVMCLDCQYPLINECNVLPYHFIQGFIDCLNAKLNLNIRATEYKGDIHLSVEEKNWFSQVYEYTGTSLPFWLIVAGGKPDITVKWWAAERYQEVVNHFRGKIQFVQVGLAEHCHPRLEGVIDLRGRTDLRQLIRLVYHADGVLCPVTSLMHLAAAVEVKVGMPQNRPCVVVAGGREPAHWEAYPHHQFIHTNGALACCAHGGCWKTTMGLSPEGRGSDVCTDMVDNLPHCMDLITAREVIERIELYYAGGALKYLIA
jgi:ADP-heptose:LPS heptosyltransferase